LTEGKVIVRLDRRDDSLMGKIVNVRITSASSLSMSGEVV